MVEGSMKIDKPALIDVRMVAGLVGVGERYVRRLVFERQIEFVKVGHYVRFDPGVVWEWIEARRQLPVAPPASRETRLGVVRAFGARPEERVR